VSDSHIKYLFTSLIKSGYKTGSPIFDENCGCVSFYSPVPIADVDMIVKANAGEWKLKKVI
jgi:hypothetical protein